MRISSWIQFSRPGGQTCQGDRFRPSLGHHGHLRVPVRFFNVPQIQQHQVRPVSRAPGCCDPAIDRTVHRFRRIGNGNVLRKGVQREFAIAAPEPVTLWPKQTFGQPSRSDPAISPDTSGTADTLMDGNSMFTPQQGIHDHDRVGLLPPLWQFQYQKFGVRRHRSQLWRCQGLQTVVFHPFGEGDLVCQKQRQELRLRHGNPAPRKTRSDTASRFTGTTAEPLQDRGCLGDNPGRPGRCRMVVANLRSRFEKRGDPFSPGIVGRVAILSSRLPRTKWSPDGALHGTVGGTSTASPVDASDGFCKRIG